ncbi:retrotransposon protein [Cucumis melo var. makuwa]|uniref:Retrotransposon protein n=1 Tax=Cucumis melo var. makuwa TaxID=1194695 RepID=A0A5D3BGA5_CUCMM|nr:retrotransposon protein [Cucumis melo var. makuwa]
MESSHFSLLVVFCCCSLWIFPAHCEELNLNKLESEPRKLGVITRAMAQRVLEERTEGTEKEVVGLKEMMLEMKKSMDRLTEEMRENHSYKKREESGTSDGSVMKLKGKMEEFDGTDEGTQGTLDRSKYKKLEMPMFLGENPKSWVYRAKQFFEINNLPATEKVKVAVVSFGQDELALQAEVISRHPQTLEQCMHEAQLVNDRNLALRLAREELGLPKPKNGEGTNRKSKGGSDKEGHKKTEFQMKQVTIPIKGRYHQNEPPIKRLSDAEFRARLDKGLCFSKEEEYPPEENGEELVELKHLVLTEGAEVELKTITSISSKGTMKLKGVLMNKEVVFLIDSGATHNFIHKKIVEDRRLPMEVTHFGDTIGDGTQCKVAEFHRYYESPLTILNYDVLGGRKTSGSQGGFDAYQG